MPVHSRPRNARSDAGTIDRLRNVLVIDGVPCHVDDCDDGLIGVMYIDELHPPLMGARSTDAPASIASVGQLLGRRAQG